MSLWVSYSTSHSQALTQPVLGHLEQMHYCKLMLMHYYKSGIMQWIQWWGQQWLKCPIMLIEWVNIPLIWTRLNNQIKMYVIINTLEPWLCIKRHPYGSGKRAVRSCAGRLRGFFFFFPFHWNFVLVVFFPQLLNCSYLNAWVVSLLPFQLSFPSCWGGISEWVAVGW